jgi:uncharacterized Zn finger protein
MARYNRYSGFPPYVSVAKKKSQSTALIAKLKKKGEAINPVIINGKNIADTFWGKAWCNNLESYSDYDNRLPRGRSYVRHGSVIDLKIQTGEIHARVQGSSLYKIHIKISAVTTEKWSSLLKDCAGKIDSLIELLQGKFSKSVMEMITHPQQGLFPHPKEITLNCSCPDDARLCKHIAAVLYGIGARLDEEPECLFQLRHVNHLDLIASVNTTDTFIQPKAKQGKKSLENTDLSALFGIELDNPAPVKTIKKKPALRTAKKVPAATVKKSRVVAKKTVPKDKARPALKKKTVKK